MEKEWSRMGKARTLAGRNLVIKSAIQSCAWYMIQSQCPSNLEDMMAVWQRVGYTYFETSALATRDVQLGRSPHRVARETLAQDYAKGGFRYQDATIFSRALLLRQVRRLLDPSPHPYRNLVYYWLT